MRIFTGILTQHGATVSPTAKRKEKASPGQCYGLNADASLPFEISYDPN